MLQERPSASEPLSSAKPLARELALVLEMPVEVLLTRSYCYKAFPSGECEECDLAPAESEVAESESEGWGAQTLLL